MKQIGAKLRDASGVSMVLALGIMMVVSIVCVSTLKVASSAPRAAYAQQDLEQSYLAATSAAKLVKHIFDTNQATALQLLQEMDACSNDHGITNNFSKEFSVQLNRTDVGATILNKFNMAQVTLTKTSDGTVTVSVSGSGYPASLSLPVDTVVWPNYADATNPLAKTTYPKNYTGTITPPENVRQYYENLSYESGSEIFFFDTWNVTGTTVTPEFTSQALCKIIWLNADGGTLSEANYGAEQPPPNDPPFPEKESAASDYYVYQGKDWEASSATDAQGILVTTKRPTYETIAKQVYTIKWRDGDGSELDTLQTTANAQEPVTTKTPIKGDAGGFYRLTGWVEGSMSGNIKTYIPQFEATPSIATKTVIWLNGDGSELEKKYYPAGGTEPTLSEGKSPTKAEDDTWWSYTFDNAWNSATDGDVTTYTPRFTGNKHKYFIKLMNGNGSVLYTHEYHSGDNYSDIFTTYTPTLTGCTFSTWGTGVSENEYTTVYNPVFTAIITWRDYARGVGNAPNLESYSDYSEQYTVGTAEPTRAAPEGYRDELYVYTGTWTLSNTTGYSKTYTATFTNSSNRENYVARWMDDSTEVYIKYITSGTTPVCENDSYSHHSAEDWTCISDAPETQIECHGTTYTNIYVRTYKLTASSP